MRQAIIVLLGVSLVFSSLSIAPTQAAAPLDREDDLIPGQRYPLPGVVIVKFKNQPGSRMGQQKTGISAVDLLLLDHSVEAIEPVAPNLRLPAKTGGPDLSRVVVIRFASGAAPLRLAADLARLEEVEYAEPQWVYPLALTPNDPLWSSQAAYLNRMEFPAAWDSIKGEDGGVVVAIVDGGTEWSHADLSSNIWSNPGEIPGNGVDDDDNGFIDDIRGWNFGNNSNDPTGLLSTPTSAGHGTHVAGIVCAVANNNNGVAGASWNAKVMPIATGFEGADGAIAYGYQGILYAAQNGADIINCSWGGLGGPSAFELEVIETANALGSAVVAAAGNQNTTEPHYPSSYPLVLSVANVTNTDVKNGGSNYGFDVDVSAQGTLIRSTWTGGGTSVLSGTSMASPHAAAVAALVKTKWPDDTPQQVLQRVRVTSDNINSNNIPFFGLLGFGRVNARRALSFESPALRITDIQLTETDGDDIIEPGETVTISVTVTNYLAPASDLTFTLTENAIAADIVDGQSTLASIGTLESVTLDPFTISIRGNAGIQTTILATLDMSAASHGYLDKDRFEFTVLPVFVTHNANNIQTSVSSLGRLGFALELGGNGSDGIGFIYNNGSNLLFEGALMLGNSASRISDAARGTNPSAQEGDFETVATPKMLNPGIVSNQQSSTTFDDRNAGQPFNVTILQQAFQFSEAPDDDYILLKYSLTNDGAEALTGLYVGWYCDWDVDGFSFLTNRTDFDAARDMMYVWDDEGGANGVFVGVSVLTPEGAAAARGIYNDQDDPRNPSWGVFDGYSTAEKWASISQMGAAMAGPADVSLAIGSGPLSLDPGATKHVTFAFLAGDDLADLQANADAAKAKWVAIEATTPVELHDLSASLDGADVVLRWRTEREEEIAGFRVLRSRDGGAFGTVGSEVVPTPGRTYSFRDPSPEPGDYVYRIAEVGTDGSIVLHGAIEIEVPAAPLRTYLAQNVPNPFNPSTSLRYGLSSPGPVRLIVYDGRGRRVRTLVQRSHAPAGQYSVTWDGRDDRGRTVASGIYVARLEITGRALSQRMTLLK